MTSDRPLRVGLLLADHLDPDVVEVVGDYTDLFPRAFAPAGIDLRVYEVTRGELPESTEECNGWITSGSRRSCYEDEGWISALHDLARRLADERRPHVGICFGHQLIARALGGDVRPAASGWGLGAKTFDVVAHAPWMTPPNDRFTMLMSHQDQVTELPPGAEVLAAAPYCPVGAYRIGDHVFAVQGHPEFVPELSRLLMEKRRDALGAVVEEGLGSLDLPLDHARIVSWMGAFLGAGAPPEQPLVEQGGI